MPETARQNNGNMPRKGSIVSVMIGRKAGNPLKMAKFANKGPKADPRRPLSHASRERFAQMVANGVKVQDAYLNAGYSGKVDSRQALRSAPDVAKRIEYLLDRRITDDNIARHKHEKPLTNRKDRIIKELESIAFSDVRDLVQWRKIPLINDDGTVILKPDGTPQTETILTFTPSNKLTQSQAAALKKIGTKAGELNLEAHDKLAALEKLAKIEGMFQDNNSLTLNQSLTTTVNQVNVGQMQSLEAARMLAFAIQKAQRVQQPIEHEAITVAKDDR